MADPPYADLAKSFFFAALRPVRLTAGFLGSGFGDIGVESHAPRDPSAASARVFGERKPPLHADSARFCDEAPARLAAFLARIIDEYEPDAGLAPFPVPFPPPRAMMDPSAAILKSFGSSNVEAAGFVPGLYLPWKPACFFELDEENNSSSNTTIEK